MTWMGSAVTKGDLLVLDGNPCMVVACVYAGGSYQVVATVYEFVEHVTASATRWRGGAAAWQLMALVESTFRYAVTWYVDGATIVVLTL